MSTDIYATAVPSQPIKWKAEVGFHNFALGSPETVWQCEHEHEDTAAAVECARAFLANIASEVKALRRVG